MRLALAAALAVLARGLRDDTARTRGAAGFDGHRHRESADPRDGAPVHGARRGSHGRAERALSTAPLRPCADRRQNLSQIAHDHGLRRVDGWEIRSLGVYCEVLVVPSDRDVDAVIAAIAADPRVDIVQHMNVFETQSTRYDDPYVGLQSAAVELDVEEAHQFATGRGVSIAIIDSGIDANHPDLRGRVRISRNLASEHPLARDGEVHGTAVAGIHRFGRQQQTRHHRRRARREHRRAARVLGRRQRQPRRAVLELLARARASRTALALKPNVINLSLDMVPRTRCCRSCSTS